MKFDKIKVVDGLSDNLDQYIGYRGFFADSILALKYKVENEDVIERLVHVPCEERGINTFESQDGSLFYLFYPCEEKGKIITTVDGFLKWYRNLYKIDDNIIPQIWLKAKGKKSYHFILEFDEKTNKVFVFGAHYSIDKLFDNFTLADGTEIME